MLGGGEPAALSLLWNLINRRFNPSLDDLVDFAFCRGALPDSVRACLGNTAESLSKFIEAYPWLLHVSNGRVINIGENGENIDMNLLPPVPIPRTDKDWNAIGKVCKLLEFEGGEASIVDLYAKIWTHAKKLPNVVGRTMEQFLFFLALNWDYFSLRNNGARVMLRSGSMVLNGIAPAFEEEVKRHAPACRMREKDRKAVVVDFIVDFLRWNESTGMLWEIWQAYCTEIPEDIREKVAITPEALHRFVAVRSRLFHIDHTGSVRLRRAARHRGNSLFSPKEMRSKSFFIPPVVEQPQYITQRSLTQDSMLGKPASPPYTTLQYNNTMPIQHNSRPAMFFVDPMAEKSKVDPQFAQFVNEMNYSKQVSRFFRSKIQHVGTLIHDSSEGKFSDSNGW